jgi:23S rRNA pseudouridine2605 synthase
VRLNKFLADRGVASRRKCDELIAAGKVSVDGEAVTVLGTRIDPQRARVEVDGVVLKPEGRRRTYLLNKPRGVVCTNERREARPRAIDLIGDPDKGRIYTVGRLDEESEGLILLTSDGELAQRVAHPRYGLTKTYHVKLRGRLESEALERVRRGVHLSEGRTSGARVRVVKRTSQFTVLEVTIAEGRNREVRRIFAEVGAKVMRLKRIRIGHLADRRLKPGQWRPLLRAEVAQLLAETGMEGGHDEGPDVAPPPRKAARATPRPQGRRFGPRAAQRWAEQNEGTAASRSGAAARKPAAGRPAAGKPAAGKPAARKPAARKPAARKPAARKPAARKPAARKPAARKPAARKKGRGR